MKPIVTIGVCVRNSASTIREAIGSVLKQSFPHTLTELIVVNGHSEDKTLSIIKDCLENTDIKNRIFHENTGLGFARQIVVDNAEGKYIVWVDGDMVISRDYVERQVDFMERNPEVGIAKGKYGLDSGANWIATLEIFSRAAGKMVNFNHDTKAQSKVLGTSGSIYRVKAIRQVEGFNKNIKGYGEDWDSEYRIRAAGWLLRTVQIEFRDYERHGLTWNDLWRRYLKRGYDLYQFSNIKKGMVSFCRMSPPAAFLAGLSHSMKIYKLTRRKVAFLLPFQYVFKMTAWCLGFVKGALNSYRI